MGAVAIIYFVGSLVLVNPARLYVSPDETANAFFARGFSQTFSLRAVYDPLAEQFDRIHPRSVLSVNGSLVPGGFLGLPVLYGALVAIVGAWSLWVLTPIFTIFAAYAWKQIISRYVSEPIGSLTFLLFLLHPAVWYYSARGLMHNVLFVDLLVLCAWMWILRPFKKQRVLCDILAGLLVGLALFVRASEFVWVAGALVLCAVIWRRYMSVRRLRAGLLGLLIGLALLFGMNTLTYGDPFNTGYTVGAVPLSGLEAQDAIDAVDVLPFGLHPREALRNFSAYGVWMFWWLSALAVLGFFVLLTVEKHRREVRAALAVSALVGIWLVLMYGSWEIHDNPDPAQITIANSYVRYWLPLYLFSTPMVAAAIVWISRRGRSVLARSLIIATLTLGVVWLNISAVFLQGQDGLLRMRRELAQGAQIQTSVLAQTPADSIIIVDRADKLFFPHRRVWYQLRDDATYEAMPALVLQAPLYYYGITLPLQDFEYLNQSRLKRLGLRIRLLESFEEESLYQIAVE